MTSKPRSVRRHDRVLRRPSTALVARQRLRRRRCSCRGRPSACRRSTAPREPLQDQRHRARAREVAVRRRSSSPARRRRVTPSSLQLRRRAAPRRGRPRRRRSRAGAAACVGEQQPASAAFFYVAVCAKVSARPRSAADAELERLDQVLVLVAQRAGRVELLRPSRRLLLLRREPVELRRELGCLDARRRQRVVEPRAVRLRAARDRRDLAHVVLVRVVLRVDGARLRPEHEQDEISDREGDQRRAGAGAASGRAAAGRPRGRGPPPAARGRRTLRRRLPRGVAGSSSKKSNSMSSSRRRSWLVDASRIYSDSLSARQREDFLSARPNVRMCPAGRAVSPATSSSAATGPSGRSAAAARARSGSRATSERAATSRSRSSPREGKAGSRAEREAAPQPRCATRAASAPRARARLRHVYIAYEYIPGRTLREAMRAGRARRPAALEAAAQIPEALAHAHAHGIVHRDVKPSNVLLAEARSIDVRLLDFGLAQMAEFETLTALGDIPGTLAYISPERLHGRDRDDRGRHLGRRRAALGGARRRASVLGRATASRRRGGSRPARRRSSACAPTCRGRARRVVDRALVVEPGSAGRRPSARPGAALAAGAAPQARAAEADRRRAARPTAPSRASALLPRRARRRRRRLDRGAALPFYPARLAARARRRRRRARLRRAARRARVRARRAVLPARRTSRSGSPASTRCWPPAGPRYVEGRARGPAARRRPAAGADRRARAAAAGWPRSRAAAPAAPPRLARPSCSQRSSPGSGAHRCRSTDRAPPLGLGVAGSRPPDAPSPRRSGRSSRPTRC